MEKYLDYVCIAFCILHMCISFIVSLFTKRKINKICEFCGSSVYSGVSHHCAVSSSGSSVDFTDSDLNAFADLLEKLVLRDNKNGS